jgi:CheY-like chemotaxis protein
MPSTSAKKVLLVDDDEEHLLICRLVLEHRGYEVLGFGNFETVDQVFEIVYSFRPNVLFVDQQISGINYERISPMLKQVPEVAHIPVICFWSGAKDERTAFPAGIDDYLPKPLKVGALLSVLAKYTGDE